MARRYRKKQALPGDPMPGGPGGPPPAPPMGGPPGAPPGGPPGAGAPPGAPPGGPGAAPPPRPGLNRPPVNPTGDPNAADPLKPRIPPPPPIGAPGAGGPGPGGPPTDVHIDAASGEVSIKKGPVSIKIAKYDPDNPPEKVKHLPAKSQRQWCEVYNSAANDGDDEETAHKKAWGVVPDKGKKSKEGAYEDDPDEKAACDVCNGLGTRGDDECSACDGTGVNYDERPHKEAEYGHSTPEEAGEAKRREQEERDMKNVCLECMGAGCEVCGGTGVTVPTLRHEASLKVRKEAIWPFDRGQGQQDQNPLGDIPAASDQDIYNAESDLASQQAIEALNQEMSSSTGRLSQMVLGDVIRNIESGGDPWELIDWGIYEFESSLNSVGDGRSSFTNSDISDLQSGLNSLNRVKEQAQGFQGPESVGNDFYEARALSASKKVSTSQEFKDSLKGNVPNLDDSRDELFYDTHDNFYGAPKNRRTPPTVDVRATVPEGQSARALAFAMQIYTSLDAEVSGQTVTIKGVSNPVGLMGELQGQGIEATVSNPKQIADSFYNNPYETYSKGEKVAVLGDVPNYNYYPNELTRKVEAHVVTKRGDKFVLENNMWGQFEVWEDGIGKL